MPVKYLVVILSVTACCGCGESRKALQKRASAGDVSATETLAKRGIASSQYQLGTMYASGYLCPTNSRSNAAERFFACDFCSGVKRFPRRSRAFAALGCPSVEATEK